MKKLLQGLKKDERGLTLVELLAVVVILAIVGAIAFVAINNVVENSKEDAHVANAMQIISAAKLAEASGVDTETVAIDVAAGDLDTIDADTLLDPWDKEGYETATVIKSGKVYTVNLVPDDDTKCVINDIEADILLGREEVCK